MTTKIVVLFGLLIILSVNGAKASGTSEETEDKADIIKSDEDGNISDSLQFVRMDLTKDKGDTIINHDNLDNENHIQHDKDTNSTDDSPNYENTLEKSAGSDEIILNPDGNVKELITPISAIRENNTEIEVIIEHITEAQDPYSYNDNEKEAIPDSEEDNSNWRSAENLNSGAREDSVEEVNDENSPEEDDRDYSLEEYKDKKLGLNVMDRVEPRNPDRRERIAKRPHRIINYGPPDDRSVMESGPMRSFSEIMVPRLRPTLTRNGIMYSPTLFSLQQPGSPILDRLSGHNWFQNRLQVNAERELLNKPRHHRVVSLPQYEDSKMIDDYNDYGGNAYSYAPGLKVTSPTPPRPVAAPNKFDIFKKLAEASNHPKSSQRTVNDNIFPGNYYPQRQYSDNYGPFDVRRFRRNAWDDEPFQDI